MIKRYPELADLDLSKPEAITDVLAKTLQSDLEELKPVLIQDLSHISHFANPTDELEVDKVEWVKENLFILHYHYGWQINYSCADQTESGVLKEKLRFTLQDDETIEFKVLKLDA
jgi:hypothetical protein